jgi:hypothetical protein
MCSSSSPAFLLGSNALRWFKSSQMPEENVVSWQMKRGGQSRSRQAATRMLAPLGEVHSDRWDEDCKRLAKAA